VSQVTRDGVVMYEVNYSIEVFDSNSEPVGGHGIGPIRVDTLVSLDPVAVLGLLDSAAESFKDDVVTALGSGYTATVTRTLSGTKAEAL
jgi:hypothetical protein